MADNKPTPFYQKLPVQGNMYHSNTISYNRRPAPIPSPVPYAYLGTEKIAKFQTSHRFKRQVSETYKAGDRNYSSPARPSPIMMTTAVHKEHHDDLKLET